MIGMRHVSLNFGTQIVFNDLSLTLNHTDRVGLVGLNGSGKSTLLRVIANQQPIDSGTIEKTSRHTIGYMPQEITLSSSLSIIDETVRNCNFDETNEYAMRAQAKKILSGLGFSLEQFEQSVSTLSVGWKMRLLLAQLLMQKADFYLFDEPTNHLDLIAKEWFLEFLKDANFGFLIVCHDRYFLDQLCNVIFELESGKCTRYRGNYTAYCQQKRVNLENLKKAFLQQQKDIARKQKTVERFRASASRARMAKNMERELEKIERITLPPEPKSIHFTFPEVKPSGKVVLTVKNLGYSFENKKIFENVSFEINRGDRVALIAPNGTGKTTLLHVIAGKYPLQKGMVKFGFNVAKTLFQQDQMASLEPQQTILENVIERAPQIQTQIIKNVLGGFLFSGETANKKISVLSGGEKNRVSMVCTLLQQANFLILDEPTNHLDIQSKEILLDALLSYQGTMLFVSHDQLFVNQLATHVLELTPTGINHYIGNYEDYLYQKKHEQTPQTEQKREEQKVQQGSNKELFLKRKEINRLEQKIERLEKNIHDLGIQLGALSYGSAEFSQKQHEFTEKQQALAETLKLWEELVQTLS